MNPPIEERDLKTLLIVLLPMCGKWRVLGIALGVKRQHLDIIEADAREVERMLERMLSQWLTSDQTYWSDLARALDSPLVTHANRSGEKDSK